MISTFFCLSAAVVMTSCSGKRPKSKVVFTTGYVGGINNTTGGGLLIYGKGDNGIEFAIPFPDGIPQPIDLPQGEYDFLFLGWQGDPNGQQIYMPYEGTTRCGFVTQLIEGDDATVNVTINANNCNSGVIQGHTGTYDNGGMKFRSLRIAACGSLIGINDENHPCGKDMNSNGVIDFPSEGLPESRGRARSFKLELEGVDPQGNPFGGGLISKCYDNTSMPSGGSGVPWIYQNMSGNELSFPSGGDGYFPMRASIHMYEKPFCQGGQPDIRVFPRGLQNGSPFAGSLFFPGSGFDAIYIDDDGVSPTNVGLFDDMLPSVRCIGGGTGSEVEFPCIRPTGSSTSSEKFDHIIHQQASSFSFKVAVGPNSSITNQICETSPTLNFSGWNPTPSATCTNCETGLCDVQVTYAAQTVGPSDSNAGFRVSTNFSYMDTVNNRMITRDLIGYIVSGPSGVGGVDQARSALELGWAITGHPNGLDFRHVWHSMYIGEDDSHVDPGVIGEIRSILGPGVLGGVFSQMGETSCADADADTGLLFDPIDQSNFRAVISNNGGDKPAWMGDPAGTTFQKRIELYKNGNVLDTILDFDCPGANEVFQGYYRGNYQGDFFDSQINATVTFEDDVEVYFQVPTLNATLAQVEATDIRVELIRMSEESNGRESEEAVYFVSQTDGGWSHVYANSVMSNLEIREYNTGVQTEYLVQNIGTVMLHAKPGVSTDGMTALTRFANSAIKVSDSMDPPFPSEAGYCSIGAGDYMIIEYMLQNQSLCDGYAGGAYWTPSTLLSYETLDWTAFRDNQGAANGPDERVCITTTDFSVNGDTECTNLPVAGMDTALPGTRGKMDNGSFLSDNNHSFFKDVNDNGDLDEMNSTGRGPAVSGDSGDGLFWNMGTLLRKAYDDECVFIGGESNTKNAIQCAFTDL